jgi:mono/diheme cytochrome c family protein
VHLNVKSAIDRKALSSTHPPIDVVNPRPPSIKLMRWIVSALLAAAIAALQPPVLAQTLGGDAGSGRQIANSQCSSCHRVLPIIFPGRGETSLIDKDGPPDFQSVADMTSTTALSLKVLLRSNHRNMPNLMLTEAESDDVIAYILSFNK